MICPWKKIHNLPAEQKQLEANLRKQYSARGGIVNRVLLFALYPMFIDKKSN